MTRYSRRAALGIGISLGSMVMGQFRSNGGFVRFPDLHVSIDEPVFALSPTRQFYEARGQTDEGTAYNFLVWHQSAEHLAAMVQVWGGQSDITIFMTESADPEGGGEVQADIVWERTAQVQRLKILPPTSAANSQAKYQKVAKSLSDPSSPIYGFESTSLVIEFDKAVFTY